MLSGNLALGSRGNRRWRKIRVDHNVGPRALIWELRRWGKRHRRNLTTQVVVFCIWYDPDNFVDGGRIVRFLPGAQRLSDGFYARQITADESLVHDCHSR